MDFNHQSILITGGTGSFGKKFTRYLLDHTHFKRIIIYSRDEYKQFLMQQEFGDHHNRLRFFIGDVRDRNRLTRALNNVNIVVHAAALKHVSLMEYNPIEAIKTNINGAENIIEAALDRGVQKVVALSTDKAVNPVNLYGATKLVSDKLFVAANAYTGNQQTRFSVVRYGNVAGSRGSVIPLFRKFIAEGAESLPITDMRMTRFWISLSQGVRLVMKAIDESRGGEIYVSKIPSFKVVDLAKAMAPELPLNEVGIRPGEKLHEAMITETDSLNTYEYPEDYIIYPALSWWRPETTLMPQGKRVKEGFRYISDENTDFLSVDQLRQLLAEMPLNS